MERETFEDFVANLPDVEEELPFLPEGMKKKHSESKGIDVAGSSGTATFQNKTEHFENGKKNRDKGKDINKRMVIGMGDSECEYKATGDDKDEKEDEPFSERKYIVLIIYDIISNKQRVRMAKLLNGYGSRVQKSAFEARLSRKQYARLLSDIKKILRKDDNVRIYKLHSYEEILTFGDKEYEIIEDVIVI